MDDRGVKPLFLVWGILKVMKTTLIKNRNKVELAVIVEGELNTAGLAFVVHGLGGFKEQIHIRTMAQGFLDKGYTVITYDAANTIGESGGRMEDATLTNYFEDLEDVVQWASTQPWYKEPLIVSGHSLGGACSLMFAAKYPEKVKAIAPICPFIAGSLYEAHQDPALMKHWQEQGYILQPSQGKPGVMKKLGWGLAEDLRTHDVRTVANKIECPVLFVAGSEDHSLPASEQELVREKLSGPSEIHVIQGMEHNPRSEEHNQELRSIIESWLKSL